MWHALIGGYKPKGLHQVFREFNFFFFFNLIEASLKPYFCKPIWLFVHNFSKALEVAKSFWENNLCLFTFELNWKAMSLYLLCLWSQTESIRVWNKITISHEVPFNKSSRRFLEVLEVLVHVDKEFMEEICVGRFQKFWGTTVGRQVGCFQRLQ